MLISRSEGEKEATEIDIRSERLSLVSHCTDRLAQYCSEDIKFFFLTSFVILVYVAIRSITIQFLAYMHLPKVLDIFEVFEFMFSL